VNRFLTEHQHN